MTNISQIEDLNGHFTKEEKWKANKHLKWCSISFVIEEMHIKPMIGSHKIGIIY